MPQQAWSSKARTAVRAHRGEPRGARDAEEEGEGDRGADGQQGAGAERRGEDELPQLDAGHLVRPPRRASAPARTRPKGRTKEQLYNEAKRMGIEGRSRMTKEQLQRAVDRRK